MIKKRMIQFICLLLLLFVMMLLIISCLKVNDNAWKNEYLQIVLDWEDEKGEEVLGYDFIYLDDDETPELVLYCVDEAWEGFDIYSIVDGKAVRLELYNLNGKKEENTLTSNGRQCQWDSYLYKQGVLLQSGGMMGCYWVKGYMYREGHLEQIFDYSYINTTDWPGNENVPILYEIKYVGSNGNIETINKKGDVHFRKCPELSILELEYGVSFSEQEELTVSSLLDYDDVICFLREDNDIARKENKDATDRDTSISVNVIVY